METVDYNKRLEDSYLDYGVDDVERTLPRIDGLKRVHRRILYAMEEEGFRSSGMHKKSAKIVGEVIGNYHPHGDKAAYNTLVNMAQPFNIRYPLIDGQGNFGSIDGDPPAAMRYTEAKLTPIAEEALKDLSEEIVPMKPTFDGENQEPVKLGTLVPLILINGTQGIATGVSTKIPPHNLNEVMDALIYCIDRQQPRYSSILDKIKGPDFARGALITNDQEKIEDIYKSGGGQFMIRARANFERSPSGRQQIAITEFPPGTTKEDIKKNIQDIRAEQEFEGSTNHVVSDVRDESGEAGVRLIIELNRGENPGAVLKQLYDKTRLERRFNSNFNYLDEEGGPTTSDLKELLQRFNAHAEEVVLNKFKYKLKQAEKEAKKLRGRVTVLEEKEKAVNILQNSKNKTEGIDNLYDEFDITKKQAKSITRLQWATLTELETAKIKDDLDDIEEDIEHYESIINDEDERKKYIKKQYRSIKREYGDERRTTIGESGVDVTVEDRTGTAMVVVGEDGRIVRFPRNSWGRFRSKDFDFPVADFALAQTDRHVLVFTDEGRSYNVPVSQIQQKRTTYLADYVDPKAGTETGIVGVARVPEYEDGYIAVTQTDGNVRLTDVSDYDSHRPTGIQGYKTKKGEFLSVQYLPEPDWHLYLFNSGRRVLHTKAEEFLRKDGDDYIAQGRTATGKKGMDFANDEHLVNAQFIESPDEAEVVIGAEDGVAKRVPAEGFREQGRGGKGLVAGRNLSVDENPIVTGTVAPDEDRIFALSGDSLERITIDELPSVDYGDKLEGELAVEGRLKPTDEVNVG